MARFKVSQQICLLLLGLVPVLTSVLAPGKNRTDGILVKSRNNIPPPEENEAKPFYLLPRHARPIKYTITLTPDLEKFTFEGRVEIQLEVTEPANNITLHAKGLSIKSIHLDGIRNPVDNRYYETTNFLVVKSKKDLSGFRTLKIKYNGNISEESDGFYRSSYVNEKNETKWLAATHFEPTQARQAFPCFDEPFFKAIFAITIIHDKRYHAISNTRGTAVPYKGLTKTVFEETKKMSSYLVAFVISDFASNSKESKNRNYTVFSKPSSINETDYALQSGVKILEALENFTKIDFPYSKIDQIAIPHLRSMATENWGLVTYQQHTLLINNEAEAVNKQQAFMVIAHEFAHQWFGNLVSPKWWRYIWLKEGFAKYFEYFISNELESDWRTIEQQVIFDIQRVAFIIDGTELSHAMNQNVYSPFEIQGVYDDISYRKGASIIRMMQHFLGENEFRNWLIEYLNEYKYKNVDSDDLFNAYKPTIQVSNSTEGVSLREIMDGWVNQKGYPVVEVRRNNTTLTFTQKRFLSDDDEIESVKDEHDYQWYIPITVVTETSSFNKTTPDAWMVPNEELVMHIDSLADSPWFIINSQLSGYYRVNYEEQNCKEIAKYLRETTTSNSSKVHPLNRAQVVDDATAFVQKGILKLDILVELMEFLVKDHDFIALFPAQRTLYWLNDFTMNTEYHEPFQKYVVSHYKAIKEELAAIKDINETNRSYIQNLTLVANTEFFCIFNDHNCLSENGSNSSPNSKYIYVNDVWKEVDEHTWNIMLNNMLNTTYDEFEKKEIIIPILTSSAKKEILNQFINYSLISEDFILGNTVEILKKIVENSEVGAEVVLEFLDSRISELSIGGNLLSLIYPTSEKISKKEHLQKLRKIANDAGGDAGFFLQDIFKQVDKRIKLLDNIRAELSNWIGLGKNVGC